jgi:hypothetical protein
LSQTHRTENLIKVPRSKLKNKGGVNALEYVKPTLATTGAVGPAFIWLWLVVVVAAVMVIAVVKYYPWVVK